jgi:hypothetical protein
MPTPETIFQILFWLGAALLVGSTLALPILLVRIPADYFVLPARPARHKRRWIFRAVVVQVLRNTVAVIFLAAGIIMLFTPGQGLMMLLAALWVATFPGKHRIERRIVSLPGVLRIVNKIRAQAGVAPLETPVPTEVNNEDH